MVHFGRSNFLRKSLSRLEIRVEKQIRTVGLGKSRSMTKQALGQGLNAAVFGHCLGRVSALWGEVVDDH